MIERARLLLDTTTPPSWSADAPLRRELERLAEEVRAFDIAAGYDEARARIKAASACERADRIERFLAGKRQGAQFANGWGLASRGHRYEI